MKCDDCGELSLNAGPRTRGKAFLPNATLNFQEERYLHLFLHTVSQIPTSGRPICSVAEVRLRKRGTLPGLVGLTTYLINEGYQTNLNGVRPSDRHVVTFYGTLLNKLSDEAVEAVMAHELAHAWLNEHIGPEASKQR
jgi:predicted SprT family Zn-dependent metalloprotease